MVPDLRRQAMSAQPPGSIPGSHLIGVELASELRESRAATVLAIEAQRDEMRGRVGGTRDGSIKVEPQEPPTGRGAGQEQRPVGVPSQRPPAGRTTKATTRATASSTKANGAPAPVAPRRRDSGAGARNPASQRETGSEVPSGVLLDERGVEALNRLLATFTRF